MPTHKPAPVASSFFDRCRQYTREEQEGIVPKPEGVIAERRDDVKKESTVQRGCEIRRTNHVSYKVEDVMG